MKVLVDTSVWSNVLRRDESHNPAIRKELTSLIAGYRAAIIGPIRQELLGGIKHKDQFDTLSSHLAAFPDLPILTEDYVMAAGFFNQSRSKGVQGSNTDFLICAVAFRSNMPIFTTDQDFQRYAKLIPIVLHEF